MGEISKFFTFYHFDSVPRFPLFLLYVTWKSGVTFVRRCFRDVIVEAMFKSRFPVILKVQTMFTPILGPDKHTGEVRFRVKTMHKKLIFWRFVYSVKNRKGGRKINHLRGRNFKATSLAEIPTPWVRFPYPA